MKNLLIILMVLIFNSCMGQKSINTYYETAYKYLYNLPDLKGNTMYLSDTIVHINLSIFFEELSEGNAKTVFLKLDSLDKARHTKNNFLPKLQNLTSDSTSKYTLFFSEIIDSVLLAEVVENKGLKNGNYEQLTAFNKSLIFLFLFDNKKQINKVYRKEMQYD